MLYINEFYCFFFFFYLANYLLESIDESIEPCENFFQFACGTWLKNNRIPDDSLLKYFVYLKKKSLFLFSFCEAGAQDTFNVLRTQLDNNVVGK